MFQVETVSKYCQVTDDGSEVEKVGEERGGDRGRWVVTRFGGEMGVMEDAPEGSV